MTSRIESEENFRPKIFIRLWKIDLSYFHIFAILATFTGIFITPVTQGSLRENLLWITARGLSLAGLYLSWLLITKFLEKNNLSPMPLWQILVVGAFGGALQSIYFDIFTWLFMLPRGSDYLTRLMSSALFAGIWLPAQSVTVINFTKFQRTREVIRDELMKLITIDQARNRLQNLDEAIVRKQIENLVVKSQVKANKVLEGALKNKAFESLPNIARSLASDHLRILAHNISELNVVSDSKIPWWAESPKFRSSVSDALQKSIRRRPLNTNWFLLVLIATVSLPIFRKEEWFIALFVLTVIAISSYLIQIIGFFFYTKFNRLPILNLFITTIFTILVPLFFVTFVPGHKPTLRHQIAYAISVVLVTCFGHIAQAGLLRQEELLLIETSALKRARAENAEINFELARITKDWAQHIHGNVQSRLHAYALVLEQAQLNGDADGVERAIEEISRTIKDLDREQSELAISTLEDEIKTTSALWDGIVKIEVEIENEIRNLKQPVVADIKKCLTEAITNSVRHGHADSMTISVFRMGSMARMEIQDNGVGFTNVRRGLGSKTFESSTRSNWTLARSDCGNQTILELNFDLDMPRLGVESTLLN
ncbi:COG4585 Signal transduction histidine kinase [Candidatus Nanopelagicaceae bacterium]